MMRFALDSTRLLPQYAIPVLCSPLAHTQIVGKAKRAVAQSNINQGDVKSLLLPFPSVSKQLETVKTADTIEGKIAVKGQRKAALHRLFQSMLHQLMMGQARIPDYRRVH